MKQGRRRSRSQCKHPSVTGMATCRSTALGCCVWPCRMGPHVSLRIARRESIYPPTPIIAPSGFCSRPLPGPPCGRMAGQASASNSLREVPAQIARASGSELHVAVTAMAGGKGQTERISESAQEEPLQCVMLKFYYHPPNTPSVRFTGLHDSSSHIRMAASM